MGPRRGRCSPVLGAAAPGVGLVPPGTGSGAGNVAAPAGADPRRGASILVRGLGRAPAGVHPRAYQVAHMELLLCRGI